MSVDTSISGSSSQVFAISEWNVFAIGAFVAFGKTKINNVNCIFGLFSSSGHEIIWLDISMDNTFLMHDLDSLDHLHCDVEHSLQVELSPAFLEQILHTLAEKVHHHDVVHFSIFSFLVTDKM